MREQSESTSQVPPATNNSESPNSSATGVGHSALAALKVTSGSDDERSGCRDKLNLLEEAIDDLIDMLEDKQQRTVNNTTRERARKVKNGFKSLKKELLKEQDLNKTDVATPSREQTQVSPNGGTPVRRSENLQIMFGTPVGTRFLPNQSESASKRKAKSPPAEINRLNKRTNKETNRVTMRQQVLSANLKEAERDNQGAPPTKRPEESGNAEAENSPADSQAWETAESKRTKKKKKKPKKNEEGRTQKKAKRSQSKRRGPQSLTNALLIRANDPNSYANILKKVGQVFPVSTEADGDLKRIRRTKKNDVLLVLNGRNRDRTEELRKLVGGELRDVAEVVSKVQEVDLEIKEIVEGTTQEEVLQALQEAAGPEWTITKDSIKNLRKYYAEMLVASIRLPVERAEKLTSGRARIRVGPINCPIRMINRATKCYKCWHLGHIASQCKSDVDRSKCCLKCGQEGHKVAQCKNTARCILCAEKGDEDKCDHSAGSFKCAVRLEEDAVRRYPKKHGKSPPMQS